MFSVAGLLVQGAATGEQGGGVSGDQHDVQAAGGGGGDEPQLRGDINKTRVFTFNVQEYVLPD